MNVIVEFCLVFTSIFAAVSDKYVATQLICACVCVCVCAYAKNTRKVKFFFFNKNQ